MFYFYKGKEIISGYKCKIIFKLCMFVDLIHDEFD